MVQGLPIFLTVMAYSHPVFMTENNYRVRLVLHHPGNHDEHEARAGQAHRHDLLDNMIAFSKKGPFSHTDHEIEIPSFKEKNITTKNQIISKSQTLLAASNITPVSVKPDVLHALEHSPPITKPSPFFLRTTILII